MSEWKRKAACRGTPIEVFFTNSMVRAKRICAGCRVTEECRAYAEAWERGIGYRSGVYAGTSGPERNAVAPLRRNGPYDDPAGPLRADAAEEE